MTRYAVLTEELYRLSLISEKYSKYNLLFASQRNDLIRTLSAMDYLVSCISIDAISNDQVHMIINTLETILRTRYFDFASSLLKAEPKAERLPNQQKLLIDLSGIISLSIGELCNKNKNYKESVRRYIAVLKTTSRALLPRTHEAWLSIEEAIRITKTYLKCN